MDLSSATKQIIVESPRNLYKWAKTFNRLQRNFFVDNVKLRREKQIEDFIHLNGFKRVKFKTDTDVFTDFKSVTRVTRSHDADLVVITDQKFSRYPCSAMIAQIHRQLEQCPNLYLCLNRHYINIDNSYRDETLDDSFTLAITQWLRRSLPELDIIDLSLDYLDIGEQFTWVIPDRHYYIKRHD